MARIVIIGPAHPLRGGGLTTFNHRLAKEFTAQGHDCSIWSFSLQYPSFMFPGKSQYTDEPAPKGITIKSVINSINPFNWIKTGNCLKKERADIIVVRYWLPLMGPALGTILRRVKKNKHTKIICIADNIIPHEKRFGDKAFTRYFIKPVDAFITMSKKVLDDLRLFEKSKPAELVPHPLYDNFGEIVSKEEARGKLGIGSQESVVLFFGFIRKYKGLDMLIEAMSILKNLKPHLASGETNLKLLVAGEFYDDEKTYQEQIDKLGIRGDLILRTGFIPDSEVKYYLCAADAVIQPYRNATQSGVTPLAYHFEKPMIVTNVGGLPALVPDKKCGLVAEPTAASIANAITEMFETGTAYYLPFVKEEKKKLSWAILVTEIEKLASIVK
jgi:glycosyltransferase involved in cell wall biosynthesis